jgi:predicted dehydrogenase
MKVLVVGCGSIGARHTMNLCALGVTDVILTDPDPARLNEVAIKYGVQATGSFAEALHQKPNAVLICSPPHLHVPLAIEAVQNGCHCFIEKPISDRLDGLDELFSEAKSRLLTLLVGYNLRYEPAIMEAQALLNRNCIGRVIYVRAEIGSYLANWRPWQDYRQSYTAKKEAGGGVILDASHELDEVRFLLGEVDRVFCAAGKLSDLEIDVEDTAEITLWFRNGALGSVHLDMMEKAKSRSCKLIGTEGTIMCDLNEGLVRWYSAAAKEWQTSRQSVDNNFTYVAELRHFFHCISGQESPRITGDDGRKALQIALAARHSAETGTIVTLPQ